MKLFLSLFTLIVVLIIGACSASFDFEDNLFNGENLSNILNEDDLTICSSEAKLCSDGSYVFREEKNCEFSECPIFLENNSIIRSVYSSKIKIPQNVIYSTDFDKIVNMEGLELSGQGIVYNDFSYSKNSYRGFNISENYPQIWFSQGDIFPWKVGSNEIGEWLEFTIDITKSGIYIPKAKIASLNGPEENLSFRIYLNGRILMNLYALKTGAWNNWETLEYSPINLSLGENQILRVEVLSAGVDWHSIWFEEYDIDNNFSNITNNNNSSGGSSGSSSEGSSSNDNNLENLPKIQFGSNFNFVNEGQEIILNWSSSNAISCIGENFETNNSINGFVNIRVFENITYSIICKNQFGTSDKKSLKIIVNKSDKIQLSCDKDPNSGIWDIFGAPLTYEPNYPYIKGHLATIRWKDIENEEGVFNFDKLDSLLKRTLNQEKRVGLIVYHGGAGVPDWIYNHVGKIITDANPNSGPGNIFPEYTDPNYAFYLYRMIDEVANHLKNWENSTEKNLIGYVQCPVGKSGDEDGWAGNVVEGKIISPAEWKEWTRQTLTHYAKAYNNSGIRIMFNLATGSKATTLNGYQVSLDDYDFAMSIFQEKPALKQGRPAHRHDMPLEMYQTEFALKVLRPNNIFTRGEMDAYFDGPYAIKDEYVTNMYWNGLWSLMVGIDQWNIQPRRYTLEESKSLEFGFNFVNKYAGFHNGSTSPGAWIAFRDSLDAADLERFPESKYGKFDVSNWGRARDSELNKVRFENILNDFYSYGARQDDPNNQYATQVEFYGAPKAWNDVKYFIYSSKNNTLGSGNYENFMTMLNPIETSQGVWRVGPKTHSYHRWARQFNDNFDSMRFLFEDSFKSSLNGPIEISVRYFDEGFGKWKLVYDAKNNPNKTAFEINNTNSKEWKEIKIQLEDYNFKSFGPNSSDLGLEYISGSNTIFHMIEVEKVNFICN